MMIFDIIKAELTIIKALEKYTNTQINNNSINKKQFNIRCPFHKDRNPSFTIYNDTNTFRCWAGCNKGKSGDVIDLVSLALNVNISLTLKILIKDLGILNCSSSNLNISISNRSKNNDFNKLF
ncbi:CHC2 zinc finger domain-containing protein [Bacillus sp. AFS017336]|uniref:CHC2 zinc finger domain-containing protein n=1 Tax=Bacillus sp. AFS017336 TaxID=2033489 RepID=UPI000BF15386|nr:CHC2 zinc finger domain-containing protein [Bacillus sp. AFS017336]PEK99494.1 hypothetical protein CN601_23785 [Bacillus sp. AFS017336]